MQQNQKTRTTNQKKSLNKLLPDAKGIDLKPDLPKIHITRKEYLLTMASWFNLDNESADKKITYGQLCILDALVFRDHNRIQILCSTQYGKSLWVAIACVILTCIFKKVVVVVAPTSRKAKIIMRYYIQHIGDHEMFASKLEKNTKLERLRQEENKERIMLNNGGGIYVVSTNERNSQKSIESAMGEGAEIVIGDEFCLVEDDTEATIFRMIAGKGKGATYVKIGNPFYKAPPNSHFYKTWIKTEKYHRIFIDYKVAIKEGRYTHDFIEDAKGKPLFDILFACDFPDSNTLDARGYRLLVQPQDIKFKQNFNKDVLRRAINQHKKQNSGKLKIKPKMGCDIGGGGDENVRVVRWKNMAAVVGTNRSSDTMVNVNEIIEDMKLYNVKSEDVNIDDIGIGRGVSDRLIELGHSINPVSAGSKPMNENKRFANIKAQLCWLAKKWVQGADNFFDPNDNWVELTWLKYKVRSGKQIIMEPKEKLKKRTKKSPDYAEAFYLTFAEVPFVGFV